MFNRNTLYDIDNNYDILCLYFVNVLRLCSFSAIEPRYFMTTIPSMLFMIIYNLVNRPYKLVKLIPYFTLINAPGACNFQGRCLLETSKNTHLKIPQNTLKYSKNVLLHYFRGLLLEFWEQRVRKGVY